MTLFVPGLGTVIPEAQIRDHKFLNLPSSTFYFISLARPRKTTTNLACVFPILAPAALVNDCVFMEGIPSCPTSDGVWGNCSQKNNDGECVCYITNFLHWNELIFSVCPCNVVCVCKWPSQRQSLARIVYVCHVCMRAYLLFWNQVILVLKATYICFWSEAGTQSGCLHVRAWTCVRCKPTTWTHVCVLHVVGRKRGRKLSWCIYSLSRFLILTPLDLAQRSCNPSFSIILKNIIKSWTMIKAHWHDPKIVQCPAFLSGLSFNTYFWRLQIPKITPHMQTVVWDILLHLSSARVIANVVQCCGCGLTTEGCAVNSCTCSLFPHLQYIPTMLYIKNHRQTK